MRTVAGLRTIADFIEARELPADKVEVEVELDGELSADIQPLRYAEPGEEQRRAFAEWARALGQREFRGVGVFAVLEGRVGGVGVEVWAEVKHFGRWTLDEGFKELIER